MSAIVERRPEIKRALRARDERLLASGSVGRAELTRANGAFTRSMLKGARIVGIGGRRLAKPKLLPV